MKQAPPEVHALLKDITVSLQNILGANLVGIYLCGSLTQNAFDPARSDIDCEVVIISELSEEQFAQTGEWLARLEKENAWAVRLQMQFLLRDEILAMDSKAYLYQFGKFTRCGSDGNPIPWKNILTSGITLYGLPPADFVPEITVKILHEALMRETGYLREEIENPASEWRDVPKYRAYAVLTLCRILYSHATGEVASKPVAAAFVMDSLPDELRKIIFQALSSDAKNWANISLEQIEQFITLTEERLKVSGSLQG